MGAGLWLGSNRRLFKEWRLAAQLLRSCRTGLQASMLRPACWALQEVSAWAIQQVGHPEIQGCRISETEQAKDRWRAVTGCSSDHFNPSQFEAILPLQVSASLNCKVTTVGDSGLGRRPRPYKGRWLCADGVSPLSPPGECWNHGLAGAVHRR